MLTNHYSIEDTLQLHSHVLEYQYNLLNTIETLGKVFPSDECQTLLSRIKEEVETLPYKTLTIFYAAYDDEDISI